MPQTSRRTLTPATLALILTALPFLTASAMLALSTGLRWSGLLLTFVQFTGPFMFILFILGSGALLYATTRTERLTDWRLILSALCLAGALVNFTLYSR
ncbi:MAG TPA: hypothetical protein VK191_11300 [Symbiobacteriaceae bacterium]|nr:hypothetical protein [Symbiobacteriaceae bacterium]